MRGPKPKRDIMVWCCVDRVTRDCKVIEAFVMRRERAKGMCQSVTPKTRPEETDRVLVRIPLVSCGKDTFLMFNTHALRARLRGEIRSGARLRRLILQLF